MASSQYPSDGDEFKTYSHYSSPPSVDCTLSLRTPSTRRSSPSSPGNSNNVYEQHRCFGGSSTCISSFFSNFLQPQNQSQYSNSYNYGTNPDRHTISNNHTANIASSGGNPPVVRCCAICHTTSTPLWRKGPKGPKTLCNACGIRFKKVERTAKAAAAATDPVGGGGIEMGKATKPERGSPGSGIPESSSFLGPSTSGTGPLPSSSTSLID